MAGFDFTAHIEENYTAHFTDTQQQLWDSRVSDVDAYFDALMSDGSSGPYGRAVYDALDDVLSDFDIYLDTLDADFWEAFREEYSGG